jgi:hypothetical protein
MSADKTDACPLSATSKTSKLRGDPPLPIEKSVGPRRFRHGVARRALAMTLVFVARRVHFFSSSAATLAGRDRRFRGVFDEGDDRP